MRKSRIYAGKKAVAAMMAAVLLICAFPMPAFADNNKINELEDEIKRKKEEREQTKGEINERKDELEDLQETTEGLKGELNNLNANLTEVSNNLEELEKQIADAKKKKEDVMATKNLLDQRNQLLLEQIDDTQGQIQHAADEITRYEELEDLQYELFCEQVRSEEERGSLSYLSVLFKAHKQQGQRQRQGQQAAEDTFRWLHGALLSVVTRGGTCGWRSGCRPRPPERPHPGTPGPRSTRCP